MIWLHPGILIIFGAFLIPLIRWRTAKKTIFVLLPVLAFFILLMTSFGYFGSLPFVTWKVSVLGKELIFGRIDALSMVFAYVFVIAAICMNIYALHVERDWEHVAAMLYVGSTLSATFAGDLFTLYIFWETMAISSLFLVWFRRTKAAHDAGFRYLLWHIFGGACLLSGIVMHVINTGSTEFTNFLSYLGKGFESVPYYLMLIGFMLNAAVPPLHAWLPDAYPEATVTGAVYMTAFTTKCAVYTLARAFPGAELLMWLGAMMAMYGVVFAMIQNDGRRLLSYHIVSQVGYMVCGVGMGTYLALNGAVAHAFCHILYKALLFMGMGAVIEVTGRNKLTDLGGLYKYMPMTFYLYMVGALSISGLPLFSGFVSKTMTVYASAELHQPIVWFLLEGATIGTFACIALKLPWNVWFKERKIELTAKEPPKNMLVGMALMASLCIFFGNYPGYRILYGILPYPVEFEPYEPLRVVETLEFFMFITFAFVLFKNKFEGEDKIVLDLDWFGRVLGSRFMSFCEGPLMNFAAFIDRKFSNMAKRIRTAFTNPEHIFGANYGSMQVLNTKDTKINFKNQNTIKISTGGALLIVLIFMLFYLAIYLIF